jgi:flotillin
MADFYSDPTNVLCVVIGMVAAMLVMMAVYASRYQRVPPDKVLVIYGRKRYETYSFTDTDGKTRTATRTVGNRFVRGGGTFVSPIIEQYSWMSLESTTLELKLPSIKTKDGRSIGVDLTVQIKIRGDADSLRTAAEQFLGKPHSEVVVAARKILEARARTVLSSMTLDEINADRKATETKLGEKLYEDMQRSGLSLTILVLKEVAVEKDTDNILSDENIKPGDLFKVVKNSRGELVVKKVDSGVEV